jgi:hypothetical protein
MLSTNRNRPLMMVKQNYWTNQLIPLSANVAGLATLSHLDIGVGVFSTNWSNSFASWISSATPKL